MSTCRQHAGECALRPAAAWRACPTPVPVVLVSAARHQDVSPRACMEPPSSAAPHWKMRPPPSWAHWAMCPQSSHPLPGSGSPRRCPCTGRVLLPLSRTPTPTPALRRRWVGHRSRQQPGTAEYLSTAPHPLGKSNHRLKSLWLGNHRKSRPCPMCKR